MDLKNELYYNPIGGPFGFGANENYDKTRRDGLEFSLESKLNDLVSLIGNYTYTKATFKGTLYSGKPSLWFLAIKHLWA